MMDIDEVLFSMKISLFHESKLVEYSKNPISVIYYLTKLKIKLLESSQQAFDKI